MAEQLQDLAVSLVARGKGILAADETVPTLTRRFDALHIPSTEQTRRDYREMLFTFPGAAEFISGVILQDPALKAWHGRDDNLTASARAIAMRARCNSAASLGAYTQDMETASA